MVELYNAIYCKIDTSDESLLFKEVPSRNVYTTKIFQLLHSNSRMKAFSQKLFEQNIDFQIIQILKLEIESEFPLIFHRVITIMLSENSGVTLPSAKTFVLLTELFVS